MTDTAPSYGPKVYRAQGGDIMRVKSGGLIDIETGGDLKYNGDSLIDEIAALSGLDSNELTLLNGAGAAGAITASKVATRDAASRIPLVTASPAAAGNSAGTATAITADQNDVTGADGTKGVILPVGVAGMRIRVRNGVDAVLKVYPDTGGTINGAGANVAFAQGPEREAVYTCTAALTWVVDVSAAETLNLAKKNLVAQGVAAGYKIARGVAAITGSGDVATGLTTVVAVTVTAQDNLDGDNLAGVSATIGNQAGAPAAGSVTIKTWKVTTGGAAGNPTMIAATVAKNVNWIAVGV